MWYKTHTHRLSLAHSAQMMLANARLNKLHEVSLLLDFPESAIRVQIMELQEEDSTCDWNAEPLPLPQWWCPSFPLALLQPLWLLLFGFLWEDLLLLHLFFPPFCGDFKSEFLLLQTKLPSMFLLTPCLHPSSGWRRYPSSECLYPPGTTSLNAPAMLYLIISPDHQNTQGLNLLLKPSLNTQHIPQKLTQNLIRQLRPNVCSPQP